MEEDQEQRHVCKLCSKSFPCGRSLGGHMRSHVIMNSAETEEKLSKKKLSSLNNGGGGGGGSNTTNTTDAGFDHTGAPVGYGLRENPKKTCRFADSSEDTLLHGKFCKDCGKVFQSWKALFGHMKCHSVEREKVSNSFEEENSWTNANQKLVMDSQSDNEAAAPNRRRRSRRRTRYMAAADAAAAATSSSFSIANNASSSVSEIEQEQEEVAMCLIMLSKDMGQWGGLNSVAESSDNNDSVFLEAPSSLRANRIKDKSAACNGGETVKLNKLMKDEKFESGNLDSESFQFMRNGSKMKKLEVSINGFLGNDKIKKSKLKDGLRLIEVSEVELGKNVIKETATDQAQPQLGSNKHKSIKKKQIFIHSFDPELVLDSSKKKKKKKIADQDASDSETCKSSHKRSKFECTTCNKIFHSYQALGGHRASHKKIKGCFASKIESSENSIETELSPDPTTTTTDIKLIKSIPNDATIDHDMPSGYPEKPETVLNKPKKIINKGHECPICFKVFNSGQALGGHKRSHLVGASETNKSNNQNIVTQKPVAEIRDLLDLNLPAPIEEESNGHIGFKPWWAGSSHKHEPLVGLISN